MQYMVTLAVHAAYGLQNLSGTGSILCVGPVWGQIGPTDWPLLPDPAHGAGPRGVLYVATMSQNRPGSGMLESGYGPNLNWTHIQHMRLVRHGYLTQHLPQAGLVHC